MGEEPKANMPCTKTFGNPCNNLASMVGCNPRQNMFSIVKIPVLRQNCNHVNASPEFANFEEIIEQAIASQRFDMPLRCLNDQMPADVQFKFRRSDKKLVPDIDVTVPLPCEMAPRGVEAAIFCKNVLDSRDKDQRIIGFDIGKVLALGSGKYPMSLRCQGDKVEVSVLTPLGISFVLSKRFTTDDFSDGWHLRLEGCKSLGESYFIRKRCLMHCAVDFKGNPTSGCINQSEGTGNTLKIECDVGLQVFDKLTLWNTNDFSPSDPIKDGLQINGWDSQFQVEIQDLLREGDLVQH